MRLALGQPGGDARRIYLSKPRGLFGCQHLAIAQTDGATYSRRASHNPLPLEDYDLDFSSFGRRHRGAIIRATNLTRRRFWEREDYAVYQNQNPEKIAKRMRKDSTAQ